MFNSDNLKFNISNSQYYSIDNKIPIKYFPIRNLLVATKFYIRDEEISNHIYINKEFTNDFRKNVVSELLNVNAELRKISLSQLKNTLQIKSDLGKLAELFVLEFEHLRLFNHPDKDKIEIISEEFVNAGYDIESFNASDSISIDRFIEVKSYDGEKSFFWSKNEIDKAKELKDRYFLYLVNRKQIGIPSYKPHIIQNPYSRVFENDLWEIEPVNWKITLL